MIYTVWTLEEGDKEALTDEFGEDAIKGDEVRISKAYGSARTFWEVPINEPAVLQRLIARFDLSDEEKAPIEEMVRTADCAERLQELENPTESQSGMLGTIQRYRDSNAICAAMDILDSRTPRFLYFSHYDRMSGENLDQSTKRAQAGKPNPGRRPGVPGFPGVRRHEPGRTHWGKAF